MTDAGLRALEEIASRLGIDRGWSEKGERRLSWHPYRLRQDLVASEPVTVDGLLVSTVVISTDVVVEPAGAVARALGAANVDPVLDGLLWRPHRRAVSALCSVAVHDANLGWSTDVLATAAALQVVSSHARAHRLGQLLGAEVALAVHPERGERPDMDPVFAIPSQVVVPAGRGRSAFAGAHRRELEEDMAELGLGSDHGAALRATVPWGRTGEQAAIEADCDAHHPQLGAGARIVLDPPRTAAPTADRSGIERGAGPDVSLLGAWGPDGRFRTFVPNLLARPGILTNVVVQHAVRSRRVGAATEAPAPERSRS